jgi:hypothetical protein
MDVRQLLLFIESKMNTAQDFKVAASLADDQGDWMFQLGKEVAMRQILKEIERLVDAK